MFIGHFAAGLAGKRLAPKASLGTHVAAAVFLDLLWPVFVLAGLESFRIVPGLLAFSPFDFVSYPWSHSLSMALVWSVVFGGVWWWRRRDRTTGIVLGAVVFSHWVLDLITHRPDLAIAPGLRWKTGLGLWRSVPATILVEGVMFLAAALWYARGTRPRDGVGRWGFAGFVVVLAVLYVSSTTPPAPGQETIVAAMGLLLVILFIPWAAWIDRHRKSL